MIRFLILGAFFSIPFLMLGVIGRAIIVKVRAGQYAKTRFAGRNSPYRPVRKPPRPFIAVLWVVVMPAGFAGFVGVRHGDLDWISGSILLLAAFVLAAFVYVAAEKRYREFGDQ